jgi:hypothetical protein
MAETRNRKIHFLNTGDRETPVWTQINVGFTSFTENLNPESEESQYIGEQNATNSVKKYAPVIDYAYKVESENVVVEKFYDIAYSQKLNEKMDILTVDLWRVDEVTSKPKATRGTYNVIPNVSGDSEPGEYLEGSGTLNQEGSLVYGYYDAETQEFVEG